MQKVFISYSRKDIDFARKLAGDLETAGYDVWWDITDLQGGDDWVRTIPNAIANSQYVIVVLTPNSIASEWVQKEYTQTLSLRKRIIPIMLVQCEVPFALNTINFVNFANGEYPDNFKKLLAPLGFTGTPPVVAPYQKAIAALPPQLLKYGIPGLIGLILLLAFIFIPKSTPPVTPTVTLTLSPAPPPTASATLQPFTATPSATLTDTPTATPTKLTSTPTLTREAFETVRLCVNVKSDVSNINVRSGPGTTYAVLGKPLDITDACLTFRAISEDQTWFLIAPNQRDAELKQYEGGWIRHDLLGLEQTGSVNLPIVTLTFTPTPSDTPTVTPTFTRTPTATSTPTSTVTSSPTPSPTPTDTDTPEPTETPAS